jgi:hypothetical protein
MKLTALLESFRKAQCSRLYVKILSENDNSKNQIYLGSDFSSLTILPYKSIDRTQKQFKAPLDFGWILEDQRVSTATHAQLILYPQYPEVRFSGFLLGCEGAPSSILTKRETGRLLFLGIGKSNSIIGFAADRDSTLVHEFNKVKNLPSSGVFIDLTSLLLLKDVRSELLNKMKGIHLKGWITSKRLDRNYKTLPCKAPNCGGYTLEAELNISPNSRSEPDYHGWEVKQHSVTDFTKINSSIITLMTPEPTGGYYKDYGVIPFVRKYGYTDKLGRPDRMNFGGLHTAKAMHPTTKLTLSLLGYDSASRKIMDLNGGIGLLTEQGDIAAIWHFSSLLEHWNRKHSNAIYVPSLNHLEPCLQYWFGNIVRLGEGTDFTLFLSAISSGNVYYDPGIKVENLSTQPKAKRRSQFRIKSSELSSLYNKMTAIDILNISQ